MAYKFWILLYTDLFILYYGYCYICWDQQILCNIHEQQSFLHLYTDIRCMKIPSFKQIWS
jgi:hypothetical protein